MIRNTVLVFKGKSPEGLPGRYLIKSTAYLKEYRKTKLLETKIENGDRMEIENNHQNRKSPVRNLGQ